MGKTTRPSCEGFKRINFGKEAGIFFFLFFFRSCCFASGPRKTTEAELECQSLYALKHARLLDLKTLKHITFFLFNFSHDWAPERTLSSKTRSFFWNGRMETWSPQNLCEKSKFCSASVFRWKERQNNTTLTKKKKEAEDTGKYERATKGIKRKDKTKNERGGNREKLGENVFYFGFRSSLFGCIAFSLLFAFYNGFVIEYCHKKTIY